MTIHILLVDNNATFMSAARNVLDVVPGVDVVGHAYGGTEALAKAELLRPDLVLLDISMQGMNGLEVGRRMRLSPSGPRIVFLSLDDNAVYRAAARDIGAEGFIGKSNFVLELLPYLEGMAAATAGQENSRLAASPGS